MGGALAIPIMQAPGLLMGIASAFARCAASADKSLHPSYKIKLWHSPRTTVGPISHVIAGPHAAEMTGIGIGRIEFAQARIVGRAFYAHGMESGVALIPAAADTAVTAGMPSR